MNKPTSRPIELLAPAKDLACGIEAVNHGADAVYIGAPKFGARAAAGNSVEDIERLCDYAHIFGVRIYVALNTILRENELAEAESIIRRLYEAGTDALIVQDMGILRLDIPPIALHASTQTDNRTVEKVKFFENEGFSQVVLARELSLESIKEIASGTSVALEVFVHGSLCVSYSGRCYISEAHCGRSANRGECAQYCRLPYTMSDSEGKIIASDKHLLSLKDLNRSDQLEELLDAGVSSLKIEGRLKDVSYVKNITAWYRSKLDNIFERRGEYRRSSAGKSSLSFEPAADKSFNRGFTPYLLHGRTDGTTAFDSPKSTGEIIGEVSSVGRSCFTVSSDKALHNGDGLVFFNEASELEGFRINKVEGCLIYPLTMPGLKTGTTIYRNSDHEFEKQLAKNSAARKINVDMLFEDSPTGLRLKLVDEGGNEIELETEFGKERAKTNQDDNIRQQLSRLGNTNFCAGKITVNMSDEWFVPSSLIAAMRRDAIARLEELRVSVHRKTALRRTKPDSPAQLNGQKVDWLCNVANSRAEDFYRERGALDVEPAFELKARKGVALMYAKHCLRYSMGWCPVHHKKASPYKEPYFLSYKNMKLRVDFDCNNCQMLIFAQ